MSRQIELSGVKTKEQVKEEVKRLLIEVKKELPLENTLREILMSRSEDIRVYVEGWRSLTEIRVEDMVIKCYKEKKYTIDVDIDIEKLITYTFLFTCDEVLAYNIKNAKVATLEIKNLKIKAL